MIYLLPRSGAMLRTLGFTGALALLLALPAQSQSELRLDLNIPANRLVVFAGDSVLKTYRVSVGLPGHDTPDGDFEIDRAEWNPWWRPPAREWAKDDKITPPGPNNPMGRVKLFFAPYYYIHGTPQVNEKDLGTPASHGCVRMRNADAIELARLLHTRARPTVAPAQIAGILARSGTTRHSTFRAPVPFTIRYQPVVVTRGELRIYPDVYKRHGVHSEAVVQALLSSGYDVTALDRAAVQRVLQRAKASKGTFTTKLAEAFPMIAAPAPAVARS